MIKNHWAGKTMVLPSTNKTSVSSRKKIVFINARSTVHPKMVIPPGLDCKYITAGPTQQQEMKGEKKKKKDKVIQENCVYR